MRARALAVAAGAAYAAAWRIGVSLSDESGEPQCVTDVTYVYGGANQCTDVVGPFGAYSFGTDSCDPTQLTVDIFLSTGCENNGTDWETPFTSVSIPYDDDTCNPVELPNGQVLSIQGLDSECDTELWKVGLYNTTACDVGGGPLLDSLTLPWYTNSCIPLGSNDTALVTYRVWEVDDFKVNFTMFASEEDCADEDNGWRLVDVSVNGDDCVRLPIMTDSAYYVKRLPVPSWSTLPSPGFGPGGGGGLSPGHPVVVAFMVLTLLSGSAAAVYFLVPTVRSRVDSSLHAARCEVQRRWVGLRHGLPAPHMNATSASTAAAAGGVELSSPDRVSFYFTSPTHASGAGGGDDEATAMRRGLITGAVVAPGSGAARGAGRGGATVASHVI